MSEPSNVAGNRAGGTASPNSPAPTLDYPSRNPADLAQEAATLVPPLPSVGVPVVADAGDNEAAALAGYEILGVLGRGGMGIVYKARQVSLNRLVALKMILAGGHAGPSELTRFRTEAEAVARLQHPNIVQIHEVGEVEGRPFFSLEFVDGGSLADKLDGTPWPAHDAARLVQTLARAIHAAHEQGIIHRDLKPANILLSSLVISHSSLADKQESTSNAQGLLPKITDFGLAKRLDSVAGQTQSGAILGTPSYMAPEQAGAKGHVIGPATDVYALGAILYELLTGRPPFKAPTPLDTVLQVVHEEPVPPSRLQPKLPHDLDTICLKCLHKDPVKRYDSALVLADELRRFLSNEPILARPARPWERAVKWARRRPATATLLGVSAVALLVLMVGGLLYQRQLQLANVQLQEQRDAAQRAKEDVEKEHGRAQAHLDNALKAVDRLLGFVGSEQLAKVPELEELRRSTMEQALEFFSGFLRQEGDDPAVRRQIASANFYAAHLYSLMGKLREAEECCYDAIKLQEKLIADFPQQPEYRNDLSKSNVRLSFLLVMKGSFREALAALDKARSLGEQLTQEHPENADFQRSLAQTYSNLGFSHIWWRTGLAEQYFRKVLPLADGLARAYPQSADDQCLLASGHGRLGMVLLFLNRLKEGEQELRRALTLLQPADSPPPRAGKEYQQYLAEVQVILGYVCFRTNQLKDAVAMLPRGIESYEQMLKDSPKDVVRRLQLAMCYPFLAELYYATGEENLGEQTFEKSDKIFEGLLQEFPALFFVRDRANASHVLALIFALRQGKTPKGLNRIRVLAEQGNLSGDLAYNLACVYALESGIVTDPSVAEERARRAIELLKRSAAAGFLHSAANIRFARNDDDLKPLRQRQDFQELLSQLEADVKNSEKNPAKP
jgi:serine/threonine-protein kinase